MTTPFTAYLIAGVTALMLTAAPGYAQTTAHEHATTPAAAQGSADQQAMMMTMMANMQAAQKKLDDLVAQMNAATGPEKVAAMAAVINEMASMHKDMCSTMMTMMEGKMKTSGDVQQHDVEHER